jgi:glycerol-3-phosphate acyltransferase PlsY
MYSPFTGFRGGKGVATGLGVFALLMPGPAGWAAVVFLVAAGATKFVSLGSILATLTVPLAGYLMGYPAETAAASAAISALVIWRHKDNIGRLIRGEENRFGSKSN